MSQVTFVFSSAPHATSRGREGIDAVLATSALCEDISVIFLGDGVAHLMKGQNTKNIGMKDYAPMLKLFDLYDIENVYVCQQSLQNMGLINAERYIDAPLCSQSEITEIIQTSEKIVHF